MSSSDFNDMGLIEEFLIENDLLMNGDLYRLYEKLTEISSIMWL